MYPFNYMYSPVFYGGYNSMAVKPGSKGGKKLVGRCAYAPTYCPEYPHCLDWYEDGSYDCNYCCVAYERSNYMHNDKRSVPQMPAYIANSLAYYKKLQDQNINALVPIVDSLMQGTKVPLPCNDDPNSCNPPYNGGVPTNNLLSIVDQLKGCVGKWALFYWKPGSGSGGPFILTAIQIVSLLEDRAGNVSKMFYLEDKDPTPYDITIQRMVELGIKAVQC
ncbi:hypothetical protein ABIA69_004561 [Lysinibacillus parviboronicapiens]|uniref:Uncharacterized protein n=1 Tax=Lysinibacillus parviboronicapiens TaxID=436516 RepID=A0ABV2PRE7_9BACI